MVTVTKEMIDGLDDTHKCEVYRQVLTSVFMAIRYEKGKDQGEALNNGIDLILAVLPELDIIP